MCPHGHSFQGGYGCPRGHCYQVSYRLPWLAPFPAATCGVVDVFCHGLLLFAVPFSWGFVAGAMVLVSVWALEHSLELGIWVYLRADRGGLCGVFEFFWKRPQY